MKRRIVLLASLTLLSFIFVAGVLAQDQAQVVKKDVKAKKALVKQEIPKKCAECPSLSKCMGEAATTACKEKHAEGAACCDGKTAECTDEQKAACCDGKTAAGCEGHAKAAEAKKPTKSVAAAKLK